MTNEDLEKMRDLEAKAEPDLIAKYMHEKALAQDECRKWIELAEELAKVLEDLVEDAQCNCPPQTLPKDCPHDPLPDSVDEALEKFNRTVGK